MCGVLGYVGQRVGRQIVFDGLKKLEYRGYDSAGIACLSDGRISLAKESGKLSELRNLLDKLPEKAGVAIGHTRWATHGPATRANAHPHVRDGVALVHNGIIENFRELKSELMNKGVTFESDTDTEVILHLLLDILNQERNMKQAMIILSRQLKGAFSLGVISDHHPTKIFLMKQGSPMVIGLGESENFFASDALALVCHTNKIVFLEDGEMGLLTDSTFELFDDAGNTYTREPAVLDDIVEGEIGKSGHKHYMLKEIYEQPAIISKTIHRFVDFDQATFNFASLGLSGLDLDRVKKIHIIGCGTAYLAGMVGQYVIESVSRTPCQVELASEVQISEPCSGQWLVLSITQSGETADTLACVKHAASKGCQTLSVCNVMYSSIPRSSDATLYMEAGPEIGVASTKAFTSQVLCLYLIANAIAHKRKLRVDFDRTFKSLKSLPQLMEKSVNLTAHIEGVSAKYADDTSCVFIGRNTNAAIAFEGALKLKEEISYIHAEEYPGGELKHGPIALIDKNMPVVSFNCYPR